MFVVHGRDVKEEIPSMPDVYHFSIDQLTAEIDELTTLNIPAVMLFGIPAQKDPIGEENFAEDGIVQQAVRAALGEVVSDEGAIARQVCGRRGGLSPGEDAHFAGPLSRASILAWSRCSAGW